jgi:beta-galactosidase
MIRFLKKYVLMLALGACFCNVVFAQGHLRQKISLNQFWQFCKSDTSKQSAWQPVTLPHTWNDKDVIDEEPGYYRGTGWYKRKLKTPADIKERSYYITFEGANNITELYINGKFVARHNGGYTAFRYNITALLKPEGDNDVMVKVNNSPRLTALPITADFTFYGGIYRDVWLEAVPELRFTMDNVASNGVYISTPAVSVNEGTVNISGQITGNNATPQRVRILAEVKDAAGMVVQTDSTEAEVPGQSNGHFAIEKIHIDHPHLWSPDDPYLYTIKLKVFAPGFSRPADQLIEPLGFRWFKMDPEKGFFLNGKPLKLMGTNRHQDRQGVGNALTGDMHEQDIRLIKEMGANFIRIAHYPQAQRLLNMCDKLGLLVWQEIPVVNEANPDPEFTFNARLMLTEMIRQYYNHPSIIIWGFMNEVFATQKMKSLNRKELLAKTTELAKNLNMIAKSEDGSRLTAMALEYTYADEYLSTGIGNITDVIGWNLYIGWYQEDMNKFGPYLDEWHKKYPGKNFIISEYGAGSDTRIHALHPERYDYSVEYQEQILNTYYKAIMERCFVAGGTVWNSFDFNSQGRQDEMPDINNKGLMTAERKYKDSYFFMQAALAKQPVLKIASLNWTNRAGRPAQPGENFCRQPVTVFTNLKQAELFLNGKSLGSKKTVDHKAVWDVPFADGGNVLFARGAGLNDKVEISFRLQPFFTDDASFKDIGVRFGAKDYFIDQPTGFVWEPEKVYSDRSWGYVSDSTTAWKPPVKYDVKGTPDDALFYTYRKNMDKIRFDVPDGEYEVELLLVDKLPGNQFDILINGIKSYTYPESAEEKAAVRKKYIVETVDKTGLQITFNKIKGDTFLSAVRVRKIH